ncbi:MAG: transcriptional regulator [Gammaproteobacteria bacterium]|nr:transcriptional regulator [Gammaproteobacteria bacterium]
MTEPSPRYGVVRSASELGRLARTHRQNRSLNLERVAAIGGFSMRFLSEFERGKETAEIGKALAALAALGLEVIVRPRVRMLPSDHEGGAPIEAGPANDAPEPLGGA